ncbi:lipoprotein signal peptidase [Microcoleus sp. FACHB-1515]|uniref:signal peptidase II n=1 Tax=Cyanophyceae TaxID=3028117 RepID=UPI001682721E|nr:signal peptidase II [Microcoleus sp. FACHB-1515]MBD2092647.1 lipoprotein signal peptidase [Microcoleus sp. FACHB-1515]
MPLRNQTFWIIAFVCIMLDQLTKYWTVQAMQLGQSIPVWPGVLNFTYVLNPGAAWGLFSEFPLLLRSLSLIVSLGLMWMGAFSRLNRWEQVSFGFLLGGALGNGIDRFVAGEVVDFLQFAFINFPVFNLADVFINIGVGCLLVVLFRKPPATNGKRSNS